MPYKVIPWDDPQGTRSFVTYLEALQYAQEHYGLRADILGTEDESEI